MTAVAFLLGPLLTCLPLLLAVWFVCWWRRVSVWWLVLSLLVASLLSYRFNSSWMLARSGEKEYPSEMGGVIEVVVGICQALAFLLVVFPAMNLQARRRATRG